MLSYDGMNNQPLHLTNIVFSSAKISHVRSFLGECLNKFIGRKMGLCKWMAWMWSAHEYTPSMHIALATRFCNGH